jgi:hypothetical protein
MSRFQGHRAGLQVNSRAIIIESQEARVAAAGSRRAAVGRGAVVVESSGSNPSNPTPNRGRAGTTVEPVQVAVRTSQRVKSDKSGKAAAAVKVYPEPRSPCWVWWALLRAYNPPEAHMHLMGAMQLNWTPDRVDEE